MIPEWNAELEAKLREIYLNSKPSDDSPSKHTGLKAVYDYLVKLESND